MWSNGASSCQCNGQRFLSGGGEEKRRLVKCWRLHESEIPTVEEVGLQVSGATKHSQKATVTSPFLLQHRLEDGW